MYGDFVSRINRRIRVLIIVLICCLCMPFASCDQQDTLIGELTPIPSDLYNCTMTTECMLIKEQCNNDDCPRLNPVGVRIDGTAVNTKYSDFQWGGVCTLILYDLKTCDRAEAQCLDGQCTRVVTSTFPNDAVSTPHRNTYMMILSMMMGVIMMTAI
eukprot:TRINITY_DN5247_c0_g1_i1.p1 TRINITY_DN5247_c0_g1~~TRINITY_DN5247_c0_g1_i1.p1  ORF type:complete len:169 (-),score=26.36 TRINITY_DN5247_c0_g1_i1:119-589(-)